MLHLEEHSPVLIRVLDEDGDRAYLPDWPESLITRLTGTCHATWPGKWVPQLDGSYLDFVPAKGRGRPKADRVHYHRCVRPDYVALLDAYLDQLRNGTINETTEE
jgi:hypothetical protein